MKHLRTAAILALGLSLLVTPGDALGQAWSVDVSFDQSFTSLEPLPSPTGFTLTAGALQVWGPFGWQVSLRGVSEPGGTVPQRCNFATCEAGPFALTHELQTLGVGLSFDFVNPTDVWLTLVVGGTVNRQSERFRNVESGERASVGSGHDYGLAAAVHLRLRPLVLGLRPQLALHYDRVFASACVPDATCWPSRDVFGVSAGFGWVLRTGSGR